MHPDSHTCAHLLTPKFHCLEFDIRQYLGWCAKAVQVCTPRAVHNSGAESIVTSLAKLGWNQNWPGSSTKAVPLMLGQGTVTLVDGQKKCLTCVSRPLCSESLSLDTRDWLSWPALPLGNQGKGEELGRGVGEAAPFSQGHQPWPRLPATPTPTAFPFFFLTEV